MLALLAALVTAVPAPPDSVVFTPLDPLYGQRECGPDDALAGPCRARVQWTGAALRARWAAEAAPVWLDGDTLTFAYVGETSGVDACCIAQLPLSRLSGTDLWVLSARVARLDEAFFSYGFLRDRERALVERGSWRGPDAPDAPPKADTLSGTVRVDSLDSGALGERRAVSVYLPPGHDPSGEAPVVYVADGQAVEGLARQIEPLILAGDVPSVVLVGIHSGPRRGEEYTGIREDTGESDAQGAIYLSHERFFVSEVLPWAERTFGVSRQRERRVVYGFSNGSVFATAMALRHPDLFGAAIPFSCGVCRAAVPERLPDVHPRFYFLAGVLEPRFHQTTERTAAQLREAGFDAVFHERVSGHDSLMWDEAFPEALRWALGE